MEQRTEIIPVKFAKDVIVRVESTLLGGEERVAFEVASFKEVTDAIEAIAISVVEALRKIKPHKAAVEFGLEIAVESGQLTALLVKGSGKANLKITLEWSQQLPEQDGDASE
jgi:hypothetical protein